jgi:hypothetical protein
VGGVTVVGLAAISQALKRPAVQVLRAQD